MQLALNANLLGAANINLNRKVLADLAITDPAAFAKVVEIAAFQVFWCWA